MHTTITTLFVALAQGAPGGLRLDPANPPQLVEAGEQEGQWYRFGEARLEVLPQVVLHLEAGAAPPSGATPLGARSWLLPAPSPAAAVHAALSWQRQAGVLSAWPDVVLPLQPAAVSFDDPERGGQWYLDLLEMDTLYARSLGAPTVRVAVIDSGIDIAHADLVDGVSAPYDAWSDDDDPSPEPGEYCPSGSSAICDEHGTAVSGVVAARADNGVGIVGLCPACTLVPIKLLGEGSGNTLSADIAAFEHAIAQDVAVINNSWGFVEAIPVPAPLAEVIDRAATEPRDGLGALVVFAAGNDDREIGDNELQALESVLCVSATDRYGAYTNYTNSGATVDVAAPSATVSLAPGDGITTTFGGTSAAAPVVSGLAGWALSIAPELSADELAALLIDTAVPSPLVTHDETGHHPVFGYGIIDPPALLEALEPPATPPTAEEAAGGCACGTVDRRGGAGLVLGLVIVGARRRRRGGSKRPTGA